MDYKKYSLENLENWLYDAISCGEATPQEIYDVIKNVVSEEYCVYKNHTERCYELLALLNGNGKENLNKYEKRLNSLLEEDNKLIYDKDDKSPKCQKAWNDFWEENYYPEEHSQYTEEELNAMCDQASSDEEKKKCQEYNLREAEYYDKRAELDSKPNKWILPVELDGLTGDCYIQLPDDLLEVANLKEGDQVEWIPQGNSSYIMKKINEHP